MSATAVEMKLELIHIPVSDVDRARDFYVKQCGWELITDHVQMGDMRIVQSQCRTGPTSDRNSRSSWAGSMSFFSRAYNVMRDGIFKELAAQC